MITDMNTAEGMAAHMRTLPTENLRELAAREVFYGPVSNLLMVTAAECELIVRGERDAPKPARVRIGGTGSRLWRWMLPGDDTMYATKAAADKAARGER